LRTDDAASYTAGQELWADVFAVVTRSTSWASEGQGIQRVMRRHGFHGLRASHGAEEAPLAGFDRRLCHAQPCLQGHAHGGQHGSSRVTVLNLDVQADPERNVPWLARARPQRRAGHGALGREGARGEGA
jgi:large subunit ribosomal protein L3